MSKLEGDQGLLPVCPFLPGEVRSNSEVALALLAWYGGSAMQISTRQMCLLPVFDLSSPIQANDSLPVKRGNAWHPEPKS